MKKLKTIAFIVVVLVVIIWGVAPVMAKGIYEAEPALYSPGMLTALRGLFAIAAMAIFINKGFNEHIRYIFYKCLVNYGFPLFNNFNHFYENFISDCSKEKISATPDKMYIEFYTEYIFHLLINDKISMSKNIFITNFFFNGENIEIIKKNLNFIIDVKENSNNIRSYIQNYLELNYDIVFNEIDIKLNKTFPKSKAVLCKILSNIVSECDKIGYLKYKKIINNDNICLMD